MFSKYPKINIRHAGLIILALFCFYILYQIFSVQSAGTAQGKTFRISKGDNFLEIAHNLKISGLIKSRLVFSGVVMARGSFTILKAGQYVFEPGLNLLQIIKKIERGDALLGENEVFIGISEGLNLAEIGERIRESGQGNVDLKNLKASYFTAQYPWISAANSKYDSLEGFLFPDTYRVEKGSDISVVVKKILKNFEIKTAALRAEAAVGRKDFYKILTMASILEKEVPPQDMPVAAGVLWKRMELGMPLQADATLVYALGRPIVKSDTSTLNSSYNTYKNKGLPPTPITNPGLTALDAAMHPVKSDYLFYLSRPHDGATVFSRTLEEHNQAKARYLYNSR